MKNLEREYISKTMGVNREINDSDMSTVCLSEYGACIATKIDESEEGKLLEYLDFDTPEGLSRTAPYGEAKQLLADLEYHITEKCDTQEWIQEYNDGTTRVLATMIVQYYEHNSINGSVIIMKNRNNIEAKNTD